MCRTEVLKMSGGWERGEGPEGWDKWELEIISMVVSGCSLKRSGVSWSCRVGSLFWSYSGRYEHLYKNFRFYRPKLEARKNF